MKDVPAAKPTRQAPALASTYTTRLQHVYLFILGRAFAVHKLVGISCKFQLRRSVCIACSLQYRKDCHPACGMCIWCGESVSHRRSARSVHRHYIYYYCFQELVAWNISIMPELLSSSIRAVRVNCSKANRILPCLPPTVIPCDPAKLLRRPSLPPYHVPLRVCEPVSLHAVDSLD